MIVAVFCGASMTPGWKAVGENAGDHLLLASGGDADAELAPGQIGGFQLAEIDIVLRRGWRGAGIASRDRDLSRR